MKVLYDFIKIYSRGDEIIEQLEEQCNWGQFTIKGKPLTRTGSFEVLQMRNRRRDGRRVLGVPWLRCPSIENQTMYKMSDIVYDIREEMHNKIGIWGIDPPNIAKIQKYNDGNVDIKPHTDKILDLAPGSKIYLIRFGATRTVILQHKVTKEIRKIDMPHNTLLILDYEDNLQWTHSVAKDPSITEPGYSIVFRNSVTFLDEEKGVVYGEHTPFKTREDISLTNLDKFYTKEEQTKELVKMYNKENNNVISLEDYRHLMDKAIYP